MALTPRDKRVLMIGGGVAGAALVLFLVTNVLGGGGGDETAAPPPPPAPGELPTVAPSPTESPSEVVNFSGRDPFSAPPALASAATPAAAVDGAGGAGTGGATSPTLAPPADTGTFTPPATGGTGTGTPSPTHTPKPEPTCKDKRKTECFDVGKHTVELQRVYMRHHRLFVDVKVDEKKEYKELKQGDRFAHSFKLVGFNDQNCPRFIFGEEAFTLCEQHKGH